jgi:hypothetical protein
MFTATLVLTLKKQKNTLTAISVAYLVTDGDRLCIG